MERYKKQFIESLSKNVLLDHTQHDYHIRFSTFIKEDFKRNWSSWSFGEQGYEGTSDDLLKALNNLKETEGEFDISGFSLWIEPSTKIDSFLATKNDYEKRIYIDNMELGLLYKDYWVMIDTVNAVEGLSSYYLPPTLVDTNAVLSLVKKNRAKYDGTGDGDSFDAGNAKLIFSKKDLHILQVD